MVGVEAAADDGLPLFHVDVWEPSAVTSPIAILKEHVEALAA